MRASRQGRRRVAERRSRGSPQRNSARFNAADTRSAWSRPQTYEVTGLGITPSPPDEVDADPKSPERTRAAHAFVRADEVERTDAVPRLAPLALERSELPTTGGSCVQDHVRPAHEDSTALARTGNPAGRAPHGAVAVHRHERHVPKDVAWWSGERRRSDRCSGKRRQEQQPQSERHNLHDNTSRRC
jgi:hypothetical protein